MESDDELLKRFAEHGDQAGFRELVERRVGLVYAVALRRLRNPHLAEEATQGVFIALARKAGRVAALPTVAGWLHRSCCYECRNMIRSRINRTARETEAQRLGFAGGGEGQGGTPAELSGLLDETLNELPERDRQAILAHYFLGQSYAQIGAASGRSENAARMRVSRALEVLRGKLERRGIASAAALLATSLPGLASVPVPAEMAARVAGGAFAGAAAVPFLSLAFMTTSKFIASAAIVAAVATVGFDVYHTHQIDAAFAATAHQAAKDARDVSDLRRQVGELTGRLRSAENLAASGDFQAAARAKAAQPGRPGVTRKAPAGWNKNGKNPSAYDVGVDSNVTWGGMPSAYVSSHDNAGDDDFSGMMQTIASDQYRGKRVQLTGWVKTDDANNGGGHLWMRIDGQQSGQMLGFDNMDGRAAQGTTDWQEYSVVLDVPSNASTLNYGYFVQGRGSMWVNGVTIQPVSTDVPTTNLLSAKPALSSAPVNLGFASGN